MKRLNIYFLFLLFLLYACDPASDKAKDAEAENDLDAARNFIQAALKGKYDMAKNYMLHDSANDGHLDAVSRMKLSSDEKQGLWDASINIHSRKLLNDSTSIVIFSNSFHKENKDTLKVVKKDGAWLVDFKYLFGQGREDSAANQNTGNTH